MPFTQQIRHIPTINSNYWAFAITGAVRHPLILSYADVAAVPAVALEAPIVCAHQSIGAPSDVPLAYTAHWRGAPLAALLEEVEIDPSVTGACLHAADGYTTSLSLDALRSAVLVYSMDGAPLRPEHGYPARIIVPGMAGYKSPKWISRIELAADPAPGFWESRGWSSTAIPVFGTLLSPARGEIVQRGTPVTLQGIAAADTVNLQVNGIPLNVQQSLSGGLLRWSADWLPEIPGDSLITVTSTASGRPSHTIEQVIPVR